MFEGGEKGKGKGKQNNAAAWEADNIGGKGKEEKKPKFPQHHICCHDTEKSFGTKNDAWNNAWQEYYCRWLSKYSKGNRKENSILDTQRKRIQSSAHFLSL